MSKNEKNSLHPSLKHYYDNWWKVQNEEIWYLASAATPDPVPDPEVEYVAGKWYFTNEADMFSQAFDSYELCKKALDNHVDYLNLPRCP